MIRRAIIEANHDLSYWRKYLSPDFDVFIVWAFNHLHAAIFL